MILFRKLIVVIQTLDKGFAHCFSIVELVRISSVFNFLFENWALETQSQDLRSQLGKEVLEEPFYDFRELRKEYVKVKRVQIVFFVLNIYAYFKSFLHKNII